MLITGTTNAVNQRGKVIYNLRPIYYRPLKLISDESISFIWDGFAVDAAVPWVSYDIVQILENTTWKGTA